MNYDVTCLMLVYLFLINKIRGNNLMDIWMIIGSMMLNEVIHDLIINFATNFGEKNINKMLSKIKQKDTLELQFYEVMKETFEEFYSRHNLEFDEKIVMTEFFKNVYEIIDIKDNIKTKQAICNTLGLEIDDKDVEVWKQIFIKTCSNPKYPWINNALLLAQNITTEQKKNMKWMETYMKDNCCKIQCNSIENLPPIFNNINVNLSTECWFYTQGLVWEIIFNAFKHGNAKKCLLHIDEKSITIVDDGIKFNPLTLKEQGTQRGGSMAIKQFMHRYCEVSLKSEYYDDCNYFKMDFGLNVFNINEMSEIIVTSIEFLSRDCKLKMPNGIFKYYYIDIDEIYSESKGYIFATFSGVISLFKKLVHDIKYLGKGKVFIYFSDIIRYKEVYSIMNEVLSTLPDLKNVEIILLPEAIIDNVEDI